MSTPCRIAVKVFGPHCCRCRLLLESDLLFEMIQDNPKHQLIDSTHILHIYRSCCGDDCQGSAIKAPLSSGCPSRYSKRSNRRAQNTKRNSLFKLQTQICTTKKKEREKFLFSSRASTNHKYNKLNCLNQRVFPPSSARCSSGTVNLNK